MRAILENIRWPRVLVVGDSRLDRHLWGDADRFAPEAPVPGRARDGRDRRTRRGTGLSMRDVHPVNRKTAGTNARAETARGAFPAQATRQIAVRS